MPFYFRLGKRSQQYNVANKDLFVIPIELLTNECIECTLFAISIGQECLNNVCQKIGLQQSEYFCLLFKSRKNCDQWVDLTKPLKKQLDKYAVQVKLYFRLQYFVPNFHFLTDEISRYHYFCAMKGLVIDGRISSSRDDAILLASFSLQAEFGDYSPERHTVEYLNNFALFPKSMVTSKPARDVLVECAINAYRNLQGVPTNVAEIYYISEAQQRDGYGQEGFPAKELDTGQDVCLGVCMRGIFVINTVANTVELFKWSDITNVRHVKKLFTIERGLEKYRKSYSTLGEDFSTCIWRTCVEQHQLYAKGLPSANQSDFANDQTTRNMVDLHFLQGKDIFNGGDHFLVKGPIVNAPSEHTNSLYETINKHSRPPSPKFSMGRFESDNVQEYNVNNSYLDKKIEFLKKRSSTEPIDLHHINLNCANGISYKAPENNGLSFAHKLQANKTASSTSSPLAKSSSNTPIYENQLNSNDLTFEQRKKLLPPYRSPPDYETFIKRKYSANLSQSLSSIPSRLASHSKNSTSSASSLVHPFQNAATFTNGTRNVMFLSSSTQSVPFLLQQRPQPFLPNIYKNFNDLSTLDIEKQTFLMTQANNSRPTTMPTVDPNVNVPAHSAAFGQYQEQQMLSSGLYTASSPELNNLNLFQKRNLQAKTEQVKSNGVARHFDDSNLKKRNHFPLHFTSVPDLTFQNTHRPSVVPEISNDYKKFTPQQQTSKSKNGFFGFTGKNLRIFRSQNNTGSEPNLSNEFDANTNSYNVPRSKLSIEHFNNLAQRRSHSINMLEPQPRHLFSYSISGKIDEAPELTPSKSNELISSDIPPKSGQPLPPPPNEYTSPLYQHKQQAIYANLNSSQAINLTANVSTPTYNNNEKPGGKIIEPNSNQSMSQMDNNNINSSSIKGGNIYFSNAPNNAHHVYEQQPRLSEIKFKENKNAEQNALLNSVEKIQNFPSTTSIQKNSRIVVFDKSFEDQDFTREFELLPRMNPTAKFTTASMNENILKNRFRDILPYEENRVKLTPTKENKHGYINASHIHMTMSSMKQHYIAAQGPLPTTTLDFWQMVYEQNISLIVMVTNFTETGVQKCYTYLPLSNEPNKNTIRFGDYEIICNYTSILPTYVTSSLTLNYNGHKRSVTHIRYTDWNDHSIPGDLHGFLSFLTEMDAIYRRNDRETGSFGKKRSANQPPSPILVHCSAGAGRSGVVILCDALLKCLDHNFSEPIDIPRALIQLRFQRMISVQHCEQFRFVCQVLSQYLSNSRLI